MSGGHAHVDAHDSFGKFVALQAAIITVFLSLFTILAHRAHTESIVMQNQSSDAWAHYQGKRIRDYQLELNSDLLRATAPTAAETGKLLSKYAKKREEYKKELEEIKTQAEEKEHIGHHAHHQGSYYDLTEGTLEVGLILSSLYFISHRKLFPLLGIGFSGVGLLIGVIGYLAPGLLG